MTIDAIALNDLMTRLIHTDAQMCAAARQEIQSWPFETVLEILALHWPEGYDLPCPEPTNRWEHFRRKWGPSEEPPQISAILDLIVIFHAQVTMDTRMVGLLLSVMARMQERERKFSAGSSNHWPGSVKNSGVYSFLNVPDYSPTWPAEKRLLAALVRLVPAITPENCDFSPLQCDALLIPLHRPYRNVDLTLNILIMLSWLGEKRHISRIEITTKNAMGTDNGQRVRVAANACLEQIRARQNKTRQSQTLLRPANNETLFPNDILLRPLANPSPDSPDQLLRPTAKEEG